MRLLDNLFPSDDKMTAEELAADIDALIVIARYEGLSDGQVAAVLRAALDEMEPTFGYEAGDRAAEAEAPTAAGAGGADRDLSPEASALADPDCGE